MQDPPSSTSLVDWAKFGRISLGWQRLSLPMGTSPHARLLSLLEAGECMTFKMWNRLGCIASSHPLQIAVSISSSIPQRIRVVDYAFNCRGNRLEASMRMLPTRLWRWFWGNSYLRYLGESRNSVPVVHSIGTVWIKIRTISHNRKYSTAWFKGI